MRFGIRNSRRPCARCSEERVSSRRRGRVRPWMQAADAEDLDAQAARPGRGGLRVRRVVSGCLILRFPNLRRGLRWSILCRKRS